MARLVDLDGFLEEAMRTPFADGVQDCALLTADWAVACGHPDPAAAYRGRYSTAVGRERLLRREGGLVAVMTAGFEGVGLTETKAPQRGDAGVIELQGCAVAAICLGSRWAFKSGGALSVGRPDRIAIAWRVAA